MRRRIAFGDPGAFIEETRDGVERLDVEFDDLPAKRGEPVDVTLKGRLRFRVAEELALPGRRHADSKSPGRRR